MQVKDVLAHKGDAVATIAPGSLVTEVIAALAQHHVGALVVSSDGRRIEGIVSERDVVRALHSRGAEPADHARPRDHDRERADLRAG